MAHRICSGVLQSGSTSAGLATTSLYDPMGRLTTVTPPSPLRPTTRAQVRAFREALERQGIPATVRIGRGLDINAGCGQLREVHAGAPEALLPAAFL